jgi:hypothetical protein
MNDLPRWLWWFLAGVGALAIVLSTVLWPLVEFLNARMKETDLHFKAKAAHPRVNEAMMSLEQNVKLRRCGAFVVGLAFLVWSVFNLAR